MNRSSILLLMSMCAGSSAYAMTLDDAINAALNNENQLKLSGLGVNQAAAVVQQAKKRNGVNINLVGQLGAEKIDSTDVANPFFDTDGVRHPRALELQFDYPIYTSGRKSLGVEVAKMQLNAQNQAFSGQKATTILQTVQVYTDVLKQQAMLTLKQRVLQNLQKSLSDSQKRFKAGVITRADLAQVQSQVAQGQADVVLAQSNLDISEAQFYQVTGLNPEQLQTVRRVPTVPNTVDQVLRQVANHPMIQQAKFEQQAAEKQYKLVKRELTPTLNVTSRVSKQNEINNFDSQSDNYMVGLQLNVPLFDQGLNRANRQKAQADVDVAQEKIQAVQQDLNKRAQTTFAQLQAIQQNRQALNEAIDAAALAFNYIQKELEFGTKTTFDALNAEQTLKDLQTQKLLNEQDEVVLVYQLLDQMGQLNNTGGSTHSAIPSTAASQPMPSSTDDMVLPTPVSTAKFSSAVMPNSAFPVPSALQSTKHKSSSQDKKRNKNKTYTTSAQLAAVDFVPIQTVPTQTQAMQSAAVASKPVLSVSLPKSEMPTTRTNVAVTPEQPFNAASSNRDRSWYKPWSWFAKSSPSLVVVPATPAAKTTALAQDVPLTPVKLPQTQPVLNVQDSTTMVQVARPVAKSLYKPWTWFAKSSKPTNRVAPLLLEPQKLQADAAYNNSLSASAEVSSVKPTSDTAKLSSVQSSTTHLKQLKQNKPSLAQKPKLKPSAPRLTEQGSSTKVQAKNQALALDSQNVNVQLELAAMPSQIATLPQPAKPSIWQKLIGLFKKQPKVNHIAAFETVQVHSPNLTERVRYRPVVSEQK